MAEALLNGVAGYEAKSAGVLEGAVNEVTQELLDWADVVFVMESWMKESILERFEVTASKIEVLGIMDVYGIGSPLLEKRIIEKLKRYNIIVP